MVDIAQIRQALVGSETQYSPDASERFAHDPDLKLLGGTAEGGWSAYQDGDLERVAALLPFMIETSQNWVRVFLLTQRNAGISPRYRLGSIT